MHHLAYSAILLVASFISSDSKNTSVSQNEINYYLRSSSESDVCMTPKCTIAAADVLTSLDETVDPCNDFYSFACGGWIKRQEKKESSVIHSVRKDVNWKLRDLLESKYENSEPPFVKKLKDFYSTCVNVDTIENHANLTLNKMLRRLGGFPALEGSQWDESKFDWIDTLISFRRLGYNHEILFKLFVSMDLQNETRHMIWFQKPDYWSYLPIQANLTLPLVLDDPKIAAYYRIMFKATELLGADMINAEDELLDALRFEIALMQISKSTPLENKFYSIKDLEKELPQVPWLKLINGIALNDANENEPIYTPHFKFFLKFAELMNATKKRAIANYMIWRAIAQSKDYLSEEWVNIGKNEPASSKRNECEEKHRWKQCISLLDKQMMVGLSSYYVRHFFNKESKDGAITVVKYIHEEIIKLLKEKDWLKQDTKKILEEKAKSLITYTGYPEEYLNDAFMMETFENLTITTDSLLENILSINKWNTDKEWLSLRMPFTQEEHMSRFLTMKDKSLITAAVEYKLYANDIGIPASILQSPFFDKDRPNYMNFGGIGNIIGLEMTNGITGKRNRKFDKTGTLINWDKESEEHFRERVNCLVDQYNNYTTDIGLKVNGSRTEDQNIADNGGIKEAYLAYQSWTKDHGIEPLLPGVKYTQNQVFWISAAQAFCSKCQPETLRKFLTTSKNSPAKFQIIGSMSNRPEFSQDFKCSPGSPMNRGHKCEVL